jgi:co-chaperonin GroES (HSP10)
MRDHVLLQAIARVNRPYVDPNGVYGRSPCRPRSKGEVVAVGPGARDEAGKLIPSDLKAGDRVLFGKWSGTEVKIDGEELLIMKESDVMGVLEGAKASRKVA